MIEKVSLYIPAFNAEKTIKEVLISSQKQSVKFDEIIVINDCSTDNTINIAKSVPNAPPIFTFDFLTFNAPCLYPSRY